LVFVKMMNIPKFFQEKSFDNDALEVNQICLTVNFLYLGFLDDFFFFWL